MNEDNELDLKQFSNFFSDKKNERFLKDVTKLSEIKMNFSKETFVIFIFAFEKYCFKLIIHKVLIFERYTLWRINFIDENKHKN